MEARGQTAQSRFSGRVIWTGEAPWPPNRPAKRKTPLGSTRKAASAARSAEIAAFRSVPADGSFFESAERRGLNPRKLSHPAMLAGPGAAIFAG